jgi:hypothetical protein
MSCWSHTKVVRVHHSQSPKLDNTFLPPSLLYVVAYSTFLLVLLRALQSMFNLGLFYNCSPLVPLLWLSSPIILDISTSSYGSTSLCWALAAFSDFLSFTQTVGLLGRWISRSQGRYLHTGQHKHKINVYRHSYFKWDSNPWSRCLSGRGQCNRNPRHTPTRIYPVSGGCLQHSATDGVQVRADRAPLNLFLT